jgi:hypothetical protein
VDTEAASSTYATGFIVDQQRGIILTNRHVITPGARPCLFSEMHVGGLMVVVLRRGGGRRVSEGSELLHATNGIPGHKPASALQ